MGTDNAPQTPIARFKELCLDTHPVDGVGTTDLSAFWAAALAISMVARVPVEIADAGRRGIDMGVGRAVALEGALVSPRLGRNVLLVPLRVRELRDLRPRGAGGTGGPGGASETAERQSHCLAFRLLSPKI